MIIDVNANLSRWPFRRMPCDELPRLLQSFAEHGVTQAWVGSLDGLLHRDIGGVNLRLAADCTSAKSVALNMPTASVGMAPRGPVELIAFGSVNPTLPDWEEDLRRCAEEYHMPGIRLHPNYHGYRLDDPLFARLLDLAAERRLIVQVVVRMDDTRVQHRLMQIPDLDTKGLADMVRKRPGLRLVVLNGLMTLRGRELKELAAVDRISFDIAMQEGVGGVAALLGSVPLRQVLFGSHLPLFPVESAMLKMRESGLDGPTRQAIEHDNAQRLLRGK